MEGEEYRNHNLVDIITPVKVEILEQLLIESRYDEDETRFLVNGFTHGFDIGYEGPLNRSDTSQNIPFKEGVGSKHELWEKVMSEVAENRYAGPFEEVPFDNFMQSPIGLVPKAENKTRQIFHLSYNFKNGNKSLNFHTPKEKYSVKYRDLDHAIKTALKIKKKFNSRKVRFAKTDLKSAFRILPLSHRSYPWLTMKAYHPVTGKLYYFIDKCLPFGASISCLHFQRFSDALKHIFEFKWRQKYNTENEDWLIEFMTNYLDDFLFISKSINRCNRMTKCFLNLCKDLGVPISHDKTEWGCVRITFLGILLDGDKCMINIPQEKRLKAANMITDIIGKKKVTKKLLEQLAGLLNFLNKAIVPGRAFTRCMYAKFTSVKDGMKDHHHIRLDSEFKEDCRTWQWFLQDCENIGIARPFIDWNDSKNATKIRYFSDASANEELGYGCLFNESWAFNRWENNFIRTYKPSIEFLELYALCIGIFTWINRLNNQRIIVF